MAGRRGGRPQRRRNSSRTQAFSFLPRRQTERRRVEFLGGVALALFLVLIIGVFLLPQLQQVALRSSYVSAVVSAILVELVNGDRSAHNLAILASSAELSAIAQAKADDMAEKGYFAHASPEGKDSRHWFANSGYEFEYAGENLAVDFSDSGDVERAWMDSPTHRENILNGNYTEIGIATAHGMYQGRETTFVVQMFGKPVLESSPAAPTSALASARPEPDVSVPEEEEEARVLGTTADRAAPEENAAGAVEVVATNADVPLWGYVLAFPSSTLRYLYYALTVLVLFALAVDTGLQFERHHAKRAWRAGFLLATMAVLFLAAEFLFFAEPVLALI